ncbi:MAG: hypothetical protein MUO99_06075 [Dehalococcoidales bacterium]|nr:hypothetical protein [Dehalococcoidales bacterium]
MAYTWVPVTSAFHTDGTHPEGYDYQTAKDALEKVAKTALGRLYVDEEGNIVYESRLVRVE